MGKVFRRIRKKMLLNDLKTWADIMNDYIKLISEIEELEKRKSEYTKVQSTRLKQLKESYADAYNKSKNEVDRIRVQLETLDA